MSHRIKFEIVALELEKLFLDDITLDKWYEYWCLLETFGWSYQDYMNRLEQVVSKEWISIYNSRNNHLCIN